MTPRPTPSFPSAAQSSSEDAATRQAFGEVVQRYQDAAVGYATALLRDRSAAEDAVQAAFLEAWLRRGQLRDPGAFGSWLRTIVRTECYRTSRRTRLHTVPLDEAFQTAPEPAAAAMIEPELGVALLALIAVLPEGDRTVIVLRYLSDFSYQDIAEFLEVPVSTVKKRLHDARKRLRAQVSTSEGGQRVLRDYRPSQDGRLVHRIMDLTTFLDAVSRGNATIVVAMLATHPEFLDAAGENARFWRGAANALAVAAISGQTGMIRLLVARGAHRAPVAATEVSPLALAAIEGRPEIVQILMDAGMPIDVFAAAALGDTSRLSRWLDTDPSLLFARTFDGRTPLHYCRTVATADLLLQAGAQLDCADDSGQTPLHWANATGQYHEFCHYLIARGAKTNASDIFWACTYGDTEAARAFVDADMSLVRVRRAPGPGVSPEMVGVTALHEAAVHGEHVIGQLLIARGADVNARGGANDFTPLHAAAAGGHLPMLRLLIASGAHLAVRDSGANATPEEWAQFFGHNEARDILRSSSTAG